MCLYLIRNVSFCNLVIGTMQICMNTWLILHKLNEDPFFSVLEKKRCNIHLIIKQGKITNLKGSLNIFWNYSHFLKHNSILITSAIDCAFKPSLCPYSLNKKTISRIAVLFRMEGINKSVLEILQKITSLSIRMLWSRLKYDWVEILLTSPHNRTDGVQYSVIIETLTTGNMIPSSISSVLNPTGKLGTKFLLKIYNPRLKNIFPNRTLFQLKIGRYVLFYHPKLRGVRRNR